MGDTGPHNDPNGHAQNLQLLLGKLLRIDVDHTEGGLRLRHSHGQSVSGPGRGAAGDLGLRFPQSRGASASIRVTGDLWLADVGQDRVEEVDIVRRGENYGWNVYRGV